MALHVLSLKLTQKYKGPRMAKVFLKNNKARGISLSNIKTKSKAPAVKQVWCWHRDSSIATCSHLMRNRNDIANRWGKDEISTSLNGVGPLRPQPHTIHKK